MFRLVILAFLSFPFVARCQNMVAGTTFVNDLTRVGVRVQNATTETEVLTDENGNFSITAQVDDLLLFYGTGIDFFRILVEPEHLKKPMVVKLSGNATELEEIIIRKFDVVEMGILPQAAKKYTPAERRYKRIASLAPTYGLGPGIASLNFSLDPIMNKLNGGIRKYKRALDAEKAEMAIQNVFRVFDSAELSKRLNISEADATELVHFACADEDFQKKVSNLTASELLFKLSAFWVTLKDRKKAGS